MIVCSLVLRGSYHDSLVLMRTAQELRSQPGVQEAAALMGTPANMEMLAAAGLATAEAADATAGDLVLAVGARDESAAKAALDAATALFATRRGGTVDQARTRTLERALVEQPESNLATISVPGEYARLEAMRALRRGLHVFLFSDNVPIEDEVALKRYAVARGLLCMGPDCGTAYLGGIGIGFANVVPRGPIGLIAASGTGMQALASEIANLGSGISHGIGVGGRDLSESVDGLMTFAALGHLDRDPHTSLIVLISKPPAAGVLPKLEKVLATVSKPVIVCCLGAPAPAHSRPDVIWMPELASAAGMAVARLRGESYVPRAFADSSGVRRKLVALDQQGSVAGRAILGLYTGGTLASEAKIILGRLLGDVDDQPPDLVGARHHIIDLGDDRYTVGQPHPMLAPETRAVRLPPWSAGTSVGVVLLDCVLGRVAHRDPLSALVAAIEQSREQAHRAERVVQFVASVTGTDADPQSLRVQRERLDAAGVVVLDSNAEATRFAAMLVRPELRAQLLES
jgi:FdrA protein